jgi:hypothetical protein
MELVSFTRKNYLGKIKSDVPFISFTRINSIWQNQKQNE